MILTVKSGGISAVPEWQAAFAEFAPGLDVCWWDDPAVRAEEVRYALVWDPEPGRIARLPGLRAVFSSGAGVDKIIADPAFPAAMPIVRCVPPEGTRRMAEYVTWAVLSLTRDLRRLSINQAAACWDTFEPPFTAAERRVGVMGLGAMGQRSAEMLAAIGVPVQGWSRSRKEIAGVRSFAGAAEFDAFLAGTDILVCLLPQTEETVGLLAAPLFAKLPRGAALVQVGRGAQQVMGDVIAALDSGQLSGAVLDVFAEEPLPAADPAWAHPKIVVTPHIGSLPSRRDRARYVAGIIAAHEQGAPLPNLFDPKRGY